MRPAEVVREGGPPRTGTGRLGATALPALLAALAACGPAADPSGASGPFTIAGSISPASKAAGATVSLGGSASATTTADAAGSFAFAGLGSGTYTVTPSGSGLTFSPPSATVTIGGSSVSGLSFAASDHGGGVGVVLADEFDGATLGPEWIALDRHGDYGNGEIQCYLPRNVSVGEGQLRITSRAEERTCGDAQHAPAGWRYTSGMVQFRSLSFTYGTVEFRARLAGGAGTWPAVWLLGADCQASNLEGADNTGRCSWPAPGSDEIDITEIKFGNQTTVWQNVISGSSGFQTCTPTVSDVSAGFHVYQLVWAPGSLRWTVDGQTTCSFTRQVPSTPMFLILNTAVGGAGGPVNDSDLPQSTLVDYVRITQP